jgi:hypothetical protein
VNMSSLQQYDRDGIEIFIDHESGESFCSVSGYSRMSGKSQSTIAEREKTYRKGEGRMSEILTSTGTKTIRLIDEDQIAEWLPKDNPVMASKIMKLGIRTLMHEIAGYSPKPQMAMSTPEMFLMCAQQVYDLHCNQKRLEESLDAHQKQLAVVQSEVASILKVQKETEESFKALPPAIKPVPSRTTRTNINTLVRNFCYKTNTGHRDAWRKLYREFRDRYHVDLGVRASNGNCAPLDIAQSLDLVDDLYALAAELFNGGSE